MFFVNNYTLKNNHVDAIVCAFSIISQGKEKWNGTFLGWMIDI